MRVYLYGCQCQPRQTVCTDILCPPGTTAERIGTGAVAHRRHSATKKRCCSTLSQSGTRIAPGATSNRGRGIRAFMVSTLIGFEALTPSAWARIVINRLVDKGDG